VIDLPGPGSAVVGAVGTARARDHVVRLRLGSFATGLDTLQDAPPQTMPSRPLV